MADEIETIEMPCLEVQQPIGQFYIGAIESVDLIDISYADVRRQDGRDIERYIGTQRDLSDGRVAELKKYVNTIDACFPTGVILAIRADDVEYDEAVGKLRIRKDDSVAKIIDGQHRIAGLKGFAGASFQINAIVFVDMDIEDQAMVFATINLKQTKVTKSLAIDLFEYTKSRSPQKTSHNVAKLMNYRDDSPFYNRIKILGRAEGPNKESQVITQATFVDRLLRLITRDAMADRDHIKRGQKLPEYLDKRAVRYIFRQMFIEEKDAEIAKALFNYFSAVRKRWPSSWANLDRGMVLARTTGYAALMRLLPYIWQELGFPISIPKEDDFGSLLSRSTLKEAEFTSEVYKPGSSGEASLFRALKEQVLNENTG